MATRNEITGALIISKASSENYRNNYDAIFGRKKMSFNQYQQEAMQLRLHSATPVYALLGLCAEAGEVADKAAKAIRDGFVPEDYQKELSKELGDCLWFIAAIAADNDLDLEEVAASNLKKLKSRRDRGVLTGSGDNR